MSVSFVIGVSFLLEVLAGLDTRHDTPPSQKPSPISRHSSREEGYAHNLWQKTRGSSICLSDESVQYWKKALSLKSVDTVLRGLLPGFELTPITDNSSSVGRPNKVLEVERAYQELELVDENLTRKEELRRIEAHLKSKISPSTLDRVRRNLGVTNAKDTGGDD